MLVKQYFSWSLDLTGSGQHGFKRNTSTAGMVLQSAIARALDAGKLAAMASIDLLTKQDKLC